MSMVWIQQHPRATFDHLGFIPDFMSVLDGRTADAQIAENYCSGWFPQKGLTLAEGAELGKPSTLALCYPGDPPLVPLWAAMLRDELVVIYEYGYTAIFQPDMSFAVSRLD